MSLTSFENQIKGIKNLDQIIEKQKKYRSICVPDHDNLYFIWRNPIGVYTKDSPFFNPDAKLVGISNKINGSEFFYDINSHICVDRNAQNNNDYNLLKKMKEGQIKIINSNNQQQQTKEKSIELPKLNINQHKNKGNQDSEEQKQMSSLQQVRMNYAKDYSHSTSQKEVPEQTRTRYNILQKSGRNKTLDYAARNWGNVLPNKSNSKSKKQFKNLNMFAKNAWRGFKNFSNILKNTDHLKKSNNKIRSFEI